MSFCALDILSSKATSGYINGLKFYAVGLGGAPMIPGSLVVSRMLKGLAKSGRSLRSSAFCSLKQMRPACRCYQFRPSPCNGGPPLNSWVGGTEHREELSFWPSQVRKFECYLAAVSERRLVLPPKCQSAHELHTLISTRGIVEGFVSYCALDGLSFKATSGYIDGLKFYAVSLGGVATIPVF